MGRGKAPEPSAFSLAIKQYVRYLVESDGGDLAGRWLARVLTRGATYYYDRLQGDKLYDTNDIADFARLWETTPQAFVRAATAYAEAVSAAAAKKITEADEWALAAKRDVIDVEETNGEGLP